MRDCVGRMKSLKMFLRCFFRRGFWVRILSRNYFFLRRRSFERVFLILCFIRLFGFFIFLSFLMIIVWSFLFFFVSFLRVLIVFVWIILFLLFRSVKSFGRNGVIYLSLLFLSVVMKLRVVSLFVLFFDVSNIFMFLKILLRSDGFVFMIFLSM